jgi:hypothetical protein
MSESTQSSTERSPFTKPGFVISAALVIALIAAVVVIFFLPKADNTAQPAPASSPDSVSAAPTKSAGAAGKSICGLPSSTETALGTAPKSKWELVGKMAAPTNPKTFGPGLTDGDGFRSCFAQSPTGALFAAANVIALGSSTTLDKVKLAEDFLVPGSGRDAAIADTKAKASPTRASGGTTQFRGFLIKSFTPAEADVDVAFQLPTGQYAHTVLSLRWVDGDWKVKASDDGQIFNAVAQLSDLSGFILWTGV